MQEDWTKISNNPVSKEVYDHLLESLRRKKAGKHYDYMAFLKAFVQGQRVLDVGVVEHDFSHMESGEWKHQYIRDWAASAVGIDILGKEIESLRKKGFNVLRVDGTSDADIGMRFDRITICDVIEHVDNPVNLLRFARRHLEDGGRILVTTPNPFWFKFIWRNLRVGTFIANAEHISWITPSLALEIGRRAGVELVQYWLPWPYGKKLITRVARKTVEMLFGDSELFAWAFYYVYRKPQDSGSQRSAEGARAPS